jgi:IS1 family transposase
MHNLHLSQVQMDELYALLKGMRGEDEERSSCWVWVATDPLSKLLLAIEVGDRSLDMAQQLVHAVVDVLAPGVVPLFLTDQLAAYGKALLTHFGCWVERVSEKSGRILYRWMPKEQLRYAQVKKRRRRRKIVAVTTKVVFGTKEAVRAVLRAAGHRDQCGCCASVAFVERLNRILRAHVPGLGRREEGLAKTKEGLRRRLMLVMGYYNLCLPHLSLRQALPSPIPTKGNGSPKPVLSLSKESGCQERQLWQGASQTTFGRWRSSCYSGYHHGDRRRQWPREKCVTNRDARGRASSLMEWGVFGSVWECSEAITCSFLVLNGA